MGRIDKKDGQICGHVVLYVDDCFVYIRRLLPFIMVRTVCSDYILFCVSFPYSFSIFFQIVSHMHLFIDPSKCSFGVITAQHPSESQRRLAGTAKLMWPQVRLSHKSIPLTASHMQEDGASWVQKNIMSANVSLWQH